ncbi:MAG: hypothetical protein DSN69_04430 [Nitrosopumilus sp. YT1]|jgi:hypothetical protein|nr:MAG: hypothetical protein DSN69_04430 [Nitrosopumilus sp. YT1]
MLDRHTTWLLKTCGNYNTKSLDLFYFKNQNARQIVSSRHAYQKEMFFIILMGTANGNFQNLNFFLNNFSGFIRYDDQTTYPWFALV